VIYSNIQLLIDAGYDYIVFDTAPTLSKLIFAVLNLSDGAFIPINMGDFALDGVQNVISTIKKVNRTSSVKLYGLIPNFVSGLSTKHKISLGQLLNKHPGKIMPFLSQRTPYTEVMNGTVPIWDIVPCQGNIKQASLQMTGVIDAMIERVNQREESHA
jgi:chromosome partitioning protein